MASYLTLYLFDRVLLPHIIRSEHRLVLWGNWERERQNFVRTCNGSRYKHAEPINKASDRAGHQAFIVSDQIDLFWQFDPARREVDNPASQLGRDFLDDRRFTILPIRRWELLSLCRISTPEDQTHHYSRDPFLHQPHHNALT